LAAERQIRWIKLVFESVGFLGRENTHELQFETDVVVALAGLFGNLQAKSTIKRRQISQPVRLKESIGLEIAIFDLIERTSAAGGMTKGGEVTSEERFKTFGAEIFAKRDGGFRERERSRIQSSDNRIQYVQAIPAGDSGPGLFGRVFVSLGKKAVKK